MLAFCSSYLASVFLSRNFLGFQSNHLLLGLPYLYHASISCVTPTFATDICGFDIHLRPIWMEWFQTRDSVKMLNYIVKFIFHTIAIYIYVNFLFRRWRRKQMNFQMSPCILLFWSHFECIATNDANPFNLIFWSLF